MRHLWWSVLALLISVGLGVWMLSFTGVIDLFDAVSAKLRQLPLVADYISAYDKGVKIEESRAQAEAELARRREALDGRAKELETKEADLTRRAQELDSRQQALDRREALLAEREQAIALASDRDKYYRELMEAVGQMRPEESARVIEQLDLELARRILGNMDPRQAAGVLGKLDPSFAGKLLAALAQLQGGSTSSSASTGAAATQTGKSR